MQLFTGILIGTVLTSLVHALVWFRREREERARNAPWFNPASELPPEFPHGRAAGYEWRTNQFVTNGNGAIVPSVDVTEPMPTPTHIPPLPPLQWERHV